MCVACSKSWSLVLKECFGTHPPILPAESVWTSSWFFLYFASLWWRTLFFFFFFLCQVSIILCSFPSIFWCSFMMWRLFCLACEDCRQGIIQAPCSFRFKDWSVLLLVAVSPFLILVNVSQLISFGLLAWYPALWKPCLDLCLSWCMHGHSQ